MRPLSSLDVDVRSSPKSSNHALLQRVLLLLPVNVHAVPARCLGFLGLVVLGESRSDEDDVGRLGR